MLVKTYRDGLARTGLHIGDANARRYFSKRTPSIELRLDDLHIQCMLPPDFWQGRPEIHDPRLSVWLEFKVARRAAGRDPIHLTMIRSQVPSGIDTFILRPALESRIDAFGAEVSYPRKPHAETVLAHRSTLALEELSVA
jgi:hypothetical protein